MFKFLKDRKKKDNKGFTLVELVIVVAILAILVGLLAPQYTKYVERSRKAADASNLDSMVTAVKVATADQQYSAIIPASGTIDVVITMTKDKTEVKYNGVDITAKKGSDGNDITQTDGAVALGNAFKEYAGVELDQSKKKKPSVRKKLQKTQERKAKQRQRVKTRQKVRGQER